MKILQGFQKVVADRKVTQNLALYKKEFLMPSGKKVKQHWSKSKNIN